MRKRSFALVAVLALGMELLGAAPALAFYSVSTISFPSDAVTFFSPFSGPAQITFSFDDVGPKYDPAKTFTIKLIKDGTTVHSDTVHIDPNPDTSPKTVSFSWPAQSVTTSTQYQVAVYDGSTLKRRRFFTLKPHLVRITSIKPNPFFPRVVNGYKDTTNVTYRLEGNSNPIKFDIFHAAAGGGCCGANVRHDEIGNLVTGTHHYIWNGRNDSAAKVPVGKYFVRITATAYTGQTQSSANTPVRVALYQRSRKTVTQNGNAFVRRGPINKLKGGGGCSVARDNSRRDAVISCHDATVKVFWRWTLPKGARNVRTGFRLLAVSGFVCKSSKGWNRPESWLRSGGLNQSRCRVDKARLTYAFLKPS
jgi:hypothetical protein